MKRYQFVWWGFGEDFTWKPLRPDPDSAIMRYIYQWCFRWLCFEVRKWKMSNPVIRRCREKRHDP